MLELSIKIGPDKKGPLYKFEVYDGLGGRRMFLLPKEDAKLLEIMFANPQTWEVIMETMLPPLRAAVAQDLSRTLKEGIDVC